MTSSGKLESPTCKILPSDEKGCLTPTHSARILSSQFLALPEGQQQNRALKHKSKSLLLLLKSVLFPAVLCFSYP